MTTPTAITDRLYASLLRQRDELRYQIERQETWLSEKRAKLAQLDVQIAEYERSRNGGDFSF
ncbi:hypothetical protein [Paenibacillus sp. NPDC057967]|uniref:hypothetical protein n=1 Tax=Paenibacillus sp. NPDC057967 TaxID=3346293 RepID=UPI0036D9CFB5